jgi:hypothetical protein
LLLRLPLLVQLSQVHLSFIQILKGRLEVRMGCSDVLC